MTRSPFYPAIFLLACALQTGTTFIIKEGEREVGRWVENDGKDDVQEIGFDESVKKKPSGPVPAPVLNSASKPKPGVKRPWGENRSGYTSAMDRQKRTGEGVVLYFHAEWCGYCKKFEKNVLNTPLVQKGLAEAPKVRIDGDREQGLMEQYRVRGYPTLLVVTPKGTTQLSTGASPARFLQDLALAGVKIRS